MLSAVVYFDGVIVDSEPLHFQAFQDVRARRNVAWAEYVETYIGFDDRDAFRERFEVHGKELSDKKLGN